MLLAKFVIEVRVPKNKKKVAIYTFRVPEGNIWHRLLETLDMMHFNIIGKDFYYIPALMCFMRLVDPFVKPLMNDHGPRNIPS